MKDWGLREPIKAVLPIQWREFVYVRWRDGVVIELPVFGYALMDSAWANRWSELIAIVADPDRPGVAILVSELESRGYSVLDTNAVDLARDAKGKAGQL